MSSQEQNIKDIKSEIIRNRRPGGVIFIAFAVLAAVIGYFAWSYFDRGSSGKDSQNALPAPAAPLVTIQAVKSVDLAVSREYIGKVEPVQIVEIRPQIAGKIERVHVKDGAAVKEGDLLFTIDSREYRAAVDLRKADVLKEEANYDRASKYYSRLLSSDKRSVSASEVDTAENDVLQGRASVEQAKASLSLAQINLGYTRITAPISGQIGKISFTKGNYVSPSGGNLAEIVQMDPMRVSFSLPDRDYLTHVAAFRTSGDMVYDSTIRLADGTVYPLKGERDFEDNSMDERSGTIRVWLRFANKDGVLIPGEMAKVWIKPAKPRSSVVAVQAAILTDAGGDYVYVVDEASIAHQRRIQLGAEIGAMREVISGLDSGEKIIISGLQMVRPESPVSPSPARDREDAKTPAELAMESGYDIAPSEDSPGDGESPNAPQSEEGKN
jgi:RND family efflux transporter MFP subunit